MPQRIDQFQGSETEYKAYLEDLVLQLRENCCACAQTRLSTASTTAGRGSHAPQQPRTSSTVSKRKRLKDTDLDVRLWQPRLVQEVPTNTPQWQIVADKLIAATPNPLREYLEEQGVLAIMRNGEAAACLLNAEQEGLQSGKNITMPSLTLCLDSGSEILANIKHYAEVSARNSRKASLAVMLANFQKLLVLSACAVVLSTEKSLQEDILDTVCILYGGTNKPYARRLVETAVFVNQLIDMLSMHGWGDRAAVLIMLCESKLAVLNRNGRY